MPAHLLQAKIRGVRSYSPLQGKTQVIDFMPLTLIVGANGSGKTTVIEALKFIIAGDEPPLSDSRRNFIHTGKYSVKSFDKSIPYASIELVFSNSRNEITHAKREISQPTNSNKSTTPGIISSYKISNSPWRYVHKQDDWHKTVPSLFNLPNRAILSHVILCHQEDNLWCMGESSSVKQIFDRIFGCEQYKREIKHIDNETKNCKTELALAEKDLVVCKERVERMNDLKEKAAKVREEIERICIETEDLDKKLEQIKCDKRKIQDEISKFEIKERELEVLRIRIIELEENESVALDALRCPPLNSKSIDDTKLDEMISEHNALVESAKSTIKQYSGDEQRLMVEIQNLEEERKSNQQIINKLQVVDLKSRESKEALAREISSITREYGMAMDMNDFQSCIHELVNQENKLRQSKCDQAELEENLSTKQLKLSREISKLEGNYQGLIEIVRNKERYIRNLKDQLAKADPLTKDILKIRENMTRMQNITNKMSRSTHVIRLSDIICETEELVDDVVQRIEDDGTKRLDKEIIKESNDLSDKQLELLDTKTKKEEMVVQSRKVEEDLKMVRGAAKEAHNKVVIFTSKKKELDRLHDQYKAERLFIETKNLDEKTYIIQNINSQIDDKRCKLSEIQASRSKLSDELSSSHIAYEQMVNNKKLRMIKSKIQEQRDNESKLLKYIKDNNMTIDLKDRMTKLEKEEMKLRDRRAMIAGSKATLEGDNYRLKLDLQGHKETLTQYSTNLGKVVCNKMILEDLEKLSGCFNQSLNSFHTQMIVKINEVLRSRWRRIYQGSDIDYIELIDEEISKSKGQTSYNYYIAMTKGGVRMKMREKGSAGQKALASIILRIALAELFVKDFAFMALDEPTANLDHENVQSLAKAIGNYVKRRAQGGFNIQWVIITHDEQFLKALDSDCSPFYYRVALDNDNHSKISKTSAI